MLRRVTIERLDDPRLDPYRDQRDAWLKARHNPAAEAGEPPGPLFMAEGSLVISALLASPFRPHSLLGTPERVATIEPQLRAWAERQHPAPTDELPIYLAPRPLLEQIVGFDLHRGLLAAGHRATPRTPEALIRGSSLLIVAEDLSNHDNVGGLFRTAAALGGAAAGVLLSPRCCDPLYRKSLRVSMGHALRIPFATLEPWPGGLRSLRTEGFRILTLSPAASGSIRRLVVRPGERVALVVGSEGSGLSGEALRALGPLAEGVSIPMAAGVDSLNVVVALGIVLDRVASGLNQGEPPGDLAGKV